MTWVAGNSAASSKPPLSELLGMTWFSWFPTGSTRQTLVAQCGLALLLCQALSKALYEESTELVQAEAKHGQVDMKALMQGYETIPRLHVQAASLTLLLYQGNSNRSPSQ